MNARLLLTVKIDDLDKKMHDLISRDELHSFASAVKQRAEEEIQLLTTKINSLEEYNTSLKVCLDKIESKQDLTEKYAKLADYKVNIISEKCEDLEHHGRANSIRIYGAEDTNGQETVSEIAEVVLGILESYLDIELTRGDIDISHRLGVFDPSSKRGIICKL